ncbi:hypothetical protein ACTVH1_17670 [Gluconobacter cerinus]
MSENITGRPSLSLNMGVRQPQNGHSQNDTSAADRLAAANRTRSSLERKRAEYLASVEHSERALSENQEEARRAYGEDTPEALREIARLAAEENVRSVTEYDAALARIRDDVLLAEAKFASGSGN